MRILSTTSLVAVAIGMAACSPTDEGASAVPSFSTEEPYETTFTPVELHRFGGDNPDALHASIGKILVDSEGDVIMSDPRAHEIHAYGNDGRYIGRIGGSGKGPGEFSGVIEPSLFNNDSLFVYDRDQYRVAVFGKDGDNWRYVRGFSPTTEMEGDYALSYAMKVADLEGYLSVESKLEVKGTVAEITDVRYRQLSEDGQVINTNFPSTKPRETLISVTESSVSVVTVPFARQSVIRFGENGTHHLAPWSEDLSIITYNAQGDSIGGLRLNVIRRPVTEADRADNFSIANGHYTGEVHETHPAFTDFVVSDKGNFWVELGRFQPDLKYWAVFSPDGEVLGKTTFPADIEPQAVRNGRLYAKTSNNADTLEMVVYEVDF